MWVRAGSENFSLRAIHLVDPYSGVGVSLRARLLRLTRLEIMARNRQLIREHLER